MADKTYAHNQGAQLGDQVPRALGAGRRLAGRDGRPGARRRRQPELDPVNQGELVMVVDL